jgi:hypothetical protein
VDGVSAEILDLEDGTIVAVDADGERVRIEER